VIRFALPLLLAATVAAATPYTPLPNRSLQCGQPGGALAWATVADEPDLRLPLSFTVEAWMRADPNQSQSPYPIVLIKPAGNRLNGECSYGFVLERATGRASFRVTTTTGTYSVTGAANLLDGAWHHLAGVRDANLLSLTVDGVQASGIVVSGTPVYTDDALCLGGSEFPGYQGNGFVGQVDEVRLWNVVRHTPDILIDRQRVLNAAPGLVAAWHFDRSYPDGFGAARWMDAADRKVARAAGAATLASGGSPATRGTGLALLEITGPVDGCGPRPALAAVRIGGKRDLVYRQLLGANNSGCGELAVVEFSGGNRVVGTLARPAGTPVVGMVARDSLAFCLEELGATQRLICVRVTNPAAPVVIGDSLEVAGRSRILLDPAAPNVLVAAGVRGGENWLSLVDVTNPAAPRLQVESDLGSTGVMGSIVDVARRGAWLYASFTDGSVRIYRIDALQFNGIVLWTINPAGTALALGGAPCLAVDGTRLYAASSDGMLRAYDLASPASPVLLGTADVAPAYATELRVLDATHVVVAGPNGVHVVLVVQLNAMGTITSFCTDMPAAFGSALTARDGLIGLCTGEAGYAQFAGASVVGVDAPAPAPASRLVAGPNPARERVWFRLPADVARDARLELFDVLGRRLREWNGLAASTSVTWDGGDGAGARVPAGIYFARLTAAGRSWSTRLTLVR
jgi:hypothetical protein